MSRSTRPLLQSFQISGEGSCRFRGSGIVLAQESFESQTARGLGDALRRLVTPRAIGCVKLGGGLTPLQVPLCPGRACGTQRQRTDCETESPGSTSSLPPGRRGVMWWLFNPPSHGGAGDDGGGGTISGRATVHR